MNKTYEIINTVFRAENSPAQRIQLDILRDRIERLLNEKNDQELYEALELTHEENIAMSNVLENCILETINNTIYTDYKNINDFRSDLFLIPVCSASKDEIIRFTSLNFIEKTLTQLFSKYQLMPERARLLLSPVFIGQNKSKELKFSDWFSLHIKTLENAAERNSREIFSKDFSLKSEPKKPILNFIFGIIVQESNSVDCMKPRLLSEDHYTKDDKNGFLEEFNEIMSKKLTKTDIKFLIPNNLYTALTLGNYEIQNMWISDLVKKYAKNPSISYVLITLDTPETFSLLIWDYEHNKILDCLKVRSYGVSTLYNVEFVMDCISETDKLAYVGKKVLSQNFLDNYHSFDFKEYLNNYGADVLQAEEEPDF